MDEEVINPIWELNDPDEDESDFYDVKVGDICISCGTPVVPQWSGIACKCRRTWFCL